MPLDQGEGEETRGGWDEPVANQPKLLIKSHIRERKFNPTYNTLKYANVSVHRGVKT